VGTPMNSSATQRRDPWNKGKLTGQKAPLRLRDIWAIRVRLQLGIKVRELAREYRVHDGRLGRPIGQQLNQGA
jgi:hypothetical protein